MHNSNVVTLNNITVIEWLNFCSYTACEWNVLGLLLVIYETFPALL